MEYNKQCRFRTILHTRSQIDSSTWSYQHTTTRSCLIWNLHHTWSYRFRHLCCEELGSYQVEKVLVMCWQDQTKHKSPSRVCSHCIVVPQNTCKKWQKWSRVVKDHVWWDHVWCPTPVYTVYVLSADLSYGRWLVVEARGQRHGEMDCSRTGQSVSAAAHYSTRLFCPDRQHKALRLMARDFYDIY